MWDGQSHKRTLLGTRGSGLGGSALQRRTRAADRPSGLPSPEPRAPSPDLAQCLPVPVGTLQPRPNATPHSGLPHPLEDAVRHRHRGCFARARHRRQRCGLLALRPDLASSAPGARPEPARQPRGPLPKSRFHVVQPGGKLRRGVQLPHVSRPRADADGLYWTRSAFGFRRQFVLSRPGDDGGRDVRLGVLLPDPRSAPGPGAPPRARGRPEHRHQLRHGARVRLLAVPLR